MLALPKLNGLVVAPHTPFHANGELRLEVIELQAERFAQQGIQAVFINGTTGEFSSLTATERLAITKQWCRVTQGTALKVIVHVGSNSVYESQFLAAAAQEAKAHAISALSPSYLKPAHLSELLQTMKGIATAAPNLPFYYYEIPSMTGMTLSPSQFLSLAIQEIPNLRGIKFTSQNLIELQLCLQLNDQQLDVAFGFDEMLLAGLALGCQSAVGSSYNFLAPLYLNLIQAFEEHDLETARSLQRKSADIIKKLASQGYMASAKYLMSCLGIPVGPPRAPLGELSDGQKKQVEALLSEEDSSLFSLETH